MGRFSAFKAWFGETVLSSTDIETTDTAEQSGDAPCTITGHDWGDGEVVGYHARGVPHFGRGDAWTMTKKLRKECPKCDQTEFEKEEIGQVKVDAETDELTIVSNTTRDPDQPALERMVRGQ